MKYQIIVPFIFLVSCCLSKEKKRIKKLSAIEYSVFERDTLFSYEGFKDSNMFFVDFEVPIDFNKINENIDLINLKVITKDKSHFEIENSLSFYDDEYENKEMMVITNAGSFDFNYSRYYYFFYSNFSYDCFECVSFLVLYKYSKEDNKLMKIPIGYQSSESPFCFGDFDNDGNLDFLHWFFNEKVKFYNIVGSELKVNYTKYLILKKDDFGSYKSIDWKKSKWS